MNLNCYWTRDRLGPMTDDNQTRLGRYQLLAKLATGGMAEIHLAKQTGIEGFERLVVVKKILPHLSSEQRFLEMFLDEARITIQLNHPNIVQTYDLGKDGEQYFMAMEYLEGESLGYLAREAHRGGKWPPPALAAGIVACVAEGLAYAHTLTDDEGEPLHIVHRDVSPQNIIVLFNGGVKLVDFGIAKAATKVHRTRVGTMKGKLAYMAPEQCAGKELDGRADIFSLGAVLWELLCRRRLFKRDNEAAIVTAIVHEPPPSIRELRPEVPEELEAVALKALAKDPAERFQTCAEMAGALREHLRRSQAAAGPAQISAFINDVFAERARTKKRLLDQVRSADGADVSLEILKPDTTESLPSRSLIEDAETVAVDSPVSAGTGSGEVAAQDAPPPSEPKLVAETIMRPTPPPGGGMGKAVGLVVGVVSLLAIILAVVFWPASGPRPAAPGAPDAGAAVQPAVGPETTSGDAGVVTPDPDPTPEPDAGPPADPEPAPKPSLLSITSKPSGCQVSVDEVEVPGKTPMTDVAVEPGQEHAVVVSCAGHQDQRKTVLIGPGQAARLAFAPAKAVVKPTFGYLKLDTDPWTEVYLRRRRLGITPLLKVRLPSGRHRLRLVNTETGLKRSLSVTIRPGKTTTLFKKLQTSGLSPATAGP